MNAQCFLSDAELIATAELTNAELDELESQLVMKAAGQGWTGDPMRQPLEVVAAIVRGIVSRRS